MKMGHNQYCRNYTNNANNIKKKQKNQIKLMPFQENMIFENTATCIKQGNLDNPVSIKEAHVATIHGK